MGQLLYIDVTNKAGWFGIISPDQEFVFAGSQFVFLDKDDDMAIVETFARDYDCHFFLDGDQPTLPFYSVPAVEIVALDSQAGYICLTADKVLYVNSDHVAFEIAESWDDFLNNPHDWQKRLVPYDGMRLYPSKEAAEKDIQFFDLDEWTKQ